MHVVFLAYGSPEKHKEFRKWVNSLEYPIEGTTRKGVNTPFMSEMKLYDVRLKEKALNGFLNDLKKRGGRADRGVSSTSVWTPDNMDNNTKKHLGRLDLVTQIISKVTAIKPINMKDIPVVETDNPSIKGWLTVIVLGKMDDPIDNKGNELL